MTLSSYPAIPDTRGSHHRGSKGFTLLEMVVVITVISVLGVVILERFLRYREMAEMTAMEQVAGIVRSAMVLRVSSLLVHHQMSRIEAMPQENPMKWLAEKPSNYQGERYDPDPHELVAGSWYYDLKNSELVYLPDWGRYFIPGPDGQKWIRFKVELVYTDIEDATQPEDNVDKEGEAKKTEEEHRNRIAGVVLNLTRPYQWF
ncbi:conserved hypothetical protein [Gammaproteobacteria bacterium]